MKNAVVSAPTVPGLLRERKNDHTLAMRVKKFGLWENITWAEYVKAVNALAAKMIDLGLEAGEHVSLLGENRPEWCIADVAIQTAGAATVGVYTTSSAEQLAYHLRHSDSVGLILEDAEQLEKWLEIQDDFPHIRWVILMDHEPFERVHQWEDIIESGLLLYGRDPSIVDNRLANIDPNQTALFIYTSGTTGDPKGAMLSHNNLLWAIDSLTSAIHIDSSDELLSFLPLSHIVERLISVTAPLKYGYSVSFTENLDTVMTNLQEIRPTVLFAVPRIWEKIHSLVELNMKDAHMLKRLTYQWAAKSLSKPNSFHHALAQLATFKILRYRLGLDRVRVAISGAAPVAPEILGYFRGIGIDIREGYGLTESTGIIAIHQHEVVLGTVGTAFPGVEMKIADDGEILSKSPGNFLGYYKDEEATAEAMSGGWLHTGDVGEIDSHDRLSITDRKKDIIITAGGKNIAPQKIENQLKSSIFINDAVVVGDRRRFLSALLVLDEDNVTHWAMERQLSYTTYTDLTQNEEVVELITEEVDAVNRTLARVENIRKFIILPKRLYHEDGEVTATLKVKRSSIENQYAKEIEDLYV